MFPSLYIPEISDSDDSSINDLIEVNLNRKTCGTKGEKCNTSKKSVILIPSDNTSSQ